MIWTPQEIRTTFSNFGLWLIMAALTATIVYQVSILQKTPDPIPVNLLLGLIAIHYSTRNSNGTPTLDVDTSATSAIKSHELASSVKTEVSK